MPYTLASGSFSFVGGVSNVFVMFILVKYVGLKQNTFIYMFSLFLSDLIYNCIVQPQVCYYQFPSAVITIFGLFYIHAAQLVCILSGSASLFFATLDKYVLIRYPYFYGNNITKNITHAVVFGIWLVCISIGIIRFHNILIIKHGYLSLIATLFVLTIMVQIMIFIIARNQDQRIQQLNRSLEHNHPRDDIGQNVAQRRASHGSNKAAKTIGLLLAVYIASWLPVNIYRLEYHLNGGDSAVYHKWIKIVNLLIQIHSCFNPWMFVARSKEMKVGIAKFLASLGYFLSVEQSSSSSHDMVVCHLRNDNPISSFHQNIQVDEKFSGRESSAFCEDSEKVQKLSNEDGTYPNNTSNSSKVSCRSIGGRRDCSYQNPHEKVDNMDEKGERRVNFTDSLGEDKAKNIKKQDMNCSAQSQSEAVNSHDETKSNLGEENFPDGSELN